MSNLRKKRRIVGHSDFSGLGELLQVRLAKMAAVQRVEKEAGTGYLSFFAGKGWKLQARLKWGDFIWGIFFPQKIPET